MIQIFLMLLLLIGSFLLFGGLVRFSENIIRPASTPPSERARTAADKPKRAA